MEQSNIEILYMDNERIVFYDGSDFCIGIIDDLKHAILYKSYASDQIKIDYSKISLHETGNKQF